MTHFAFELRSGRHLGVSGLGEPLATRVVVLCHPAGAGGAFDPDPAASVASGLRIIGIDRPGYGATDPYPGEPDVRVWVDDVREYLQRIGPSSVESTGVRLGIAGVIGVGYGAFAAAALAASRPPLIDRLVLLEPAAPAAGQWTDDPALETSGRNTDAGLLDRTDAALTHAAAAGLAADVALFGDGEWAEVLSRVTVPVDLIAAAGSPGAEWWRSHLAVSDVHTTAASGLTGLADGWPAALDLLAGDEQSRPDRAAQAET